MHPSLQYTPINMEQAPTRTQTAQQQRNNLQNTINSYLGEGDSSAGNVVLVPGLIKLVGREADDYLRRYHSIYTTINTRLQANKRR